MSDHLSRWTASENRPLFGTRSTDNPCWRKRRNMQHGELNLSEIVKCYRGGWMKTSRRNVFHSTTTILRNKGRQAQILALYSSTTKSVAKRDHDDLFDLRKLTIYCGYGPYRDFLPSCIQSWTLTEWQVPNGCGSWQPWGNEFYFPLRKRIWVTMDFLFD